MRRALGACALLLLLTAACTDPQAGGSPTPGLSAPAAGTATAGATAAGTPGATTAQSPSPGATTPPAGALALDSIVAPTVALNLRAEPGTAAMRLGTLGAGSQSFLVEGPAQADGYTWYQVSGLGLPPASGCTTPIETEPYNCPIWFGWVASASLEGVPWLEVVNVECPDPQPYEAEDYNLAKPPLHLLHCYGDQTTTLRAWLPEQTSPPCPNQDAAAWLACPEVTLGWGQDYPSGLTAAIDPASGVALPAPNQWVEVTGHMNDPQSSQCRPLPDQPAEQAVVFCRATLVLDSITPTAAP